MPAQVSANQVCEAALADRILVAPGSLFSNSGRFDHYLRINCGWPYGEAVDTGLRRLGQIIETLSRGAGAGSASPRHPPEAGRLQSSSARAA
jgi:DNA-binding transcriptional MocR family regulator